MYLMTKRLMVGTITLMSVAAGTVLLGLRIPTGEFEPVEYNPEIAQFKGTVKTEWIRRDDPAESTKFKLLDSFEYVASNGTVWKADAGAIIDGASIPRAFWSIIGGPTTGPYRDASVIHDVYCESKERHWEETHWVFHDACREAGLGPWKANLMYLAVYHYGPIWDEQGNIQRETVEVDLETACRMRDCCKQNPDLTGPELRALDPAIWETNGTD